MVKGRKTAIKTSNESGYQFLVLLLVVGATLIAIFPLIYVVSTSLVSIEEFNRKSGIIFWPSAPTLKAYGMVLNGTYFFDGMKVSAFRTVVGTCLTLIMTVVVAYVASRVKMPGRNLLVTLVLITILFNGGMIPTFLVVRDLNLLDSTWSMILPTLIDGFSVLVVKQFFENIPEEIGESALMDGASEIQLMFRILVPMSAPALAAIGLFTAVFHWNAWFDAFIYINDPHKQPIQLVTRALMLKSDAYMTLIKGSDTVSVITIKMAGVMLATLPILCVYPFLQKYFTKGMFMGAVKG